MLTFDLIRFGFRGSNETPSAVAACDFIRYYSTATYALANP